MKRNLLVLIAIFYCLAGAQAQTSYGLKTGLNFAKFKASSVMANYTSNAATSFYVTGYADVPVASKISIQPGISLQGKGGSVPAGDFGVAEKNKDNYMYLEVPVNVVYYIPTGDVGDVFFGAGPYAGIGLRAKTSQGNFSESGSFSDAGLNLFDAGVNFLAGFKMSQGILINAGYSLGLTNMIKDIEGASAKNRVFSIGLGFQF